MPTKLSKDVIIYFLEERIKDLNFALAYVSERNNRAIVKMRINEIEDKLKAVRENEEG